MRILLAEDQVWLRSALRLLIEQESDMVVVGEVSDTLSLLDAMASLRPDLVLVDWDLPGMKTAGARRWMLTTLRAVQPQVSIVALGSGDINHRAGLSGNIDFYVSKAEPANRLLAALHKAKAAHDDHAQPIEAG